MNEILPNIEIVDLAVFLPKSNVLAISDLQLGTEEMMVGQGIFLPRFNFKEISSRLEKIFSELKKRGVKQLEKIVVNGDLKQEFGKISEQEWNEVLDTIELLQKHCKEIVLVKGNHDMVLGPIAKWKNLKTVEAFYLDREKVLFLHGNSTKILKEFVEAKTLVVGHEHPAVSIREGVKTETFKCFLKGKYEGKNLVVMPSMNAVKIGSNVLREKQLSPFLKQDLSNFEVWVVEDKPYHFGKLKELF
ncbi:MAG: metallophosphoesterase [Candidatus Diapherotrites archaeon]|uniref:Metallophosphoesterase n=1 Tax=Candidatus Iainarchaeum sp. TaxID=3101447 RepID=A0A7J4IV51_9ARCH|nr:MAG: hypothetical protein QT03_C0001G0252 [archaeon GW2011_AR10]MBS3059734.1 metallophosphoesterase [Candidatus Diapherotrites archaeon]HIH08700.1 metallophosphoesterase [Candidatus Diapherotrites archaeon]